MTGWARQKGRLRRHLRIRKRVAGWNGRLRLVVHRSARHISAQIIDDERGVTIVSASSFDKELRSKTQGMKKVDAAKIVGEALARRAKEKSVEKIVFDRGGYQYHGRVKALAEAARGGGLQF